MSARRILAALLLLVPALSAPVTANQPLTVGGPAEVTALAVARNETGQVVGANATIEVSVATQGSGHVFMDTRPLAGTDLQGSARIASRVAGSLTGNPVGSNDLFYVVRSDSPLLSGPSAGSVMALAASVALHNAHLEPGEDRWQLREDVMATGTIGPDGSIGPVGGILEKAKAASNAGASLFLVPQGQGNYTPRLPGQAPDTNGTVDVPERCREKFNITCREVGHIETLVEIATGVTIPQPELGEPPSTAQYEDLLAPRTRTLVDNASHVFEVWDRLNDTNLPTDQEKRVFSAINGSAQAYQRADRFWSEDRFYKAASEAFESSIRGRYAQMLLEYYRQNRQLGFVQDRIDEAAEEVSRAEQAAQKAEVTGMHTLYTVGAGQSRALEAKNHLDQARQALDSQRNPRNALFQSSWAIQRAGTVHWWLELGEAIGPGPAIPVEPEQLAGEFVNLASELLVYTGSVVGEPQGPQRARERLDQAKQNQARGFHAAAVTEALKAQVLAQMAIEIQEDGPGPEKVQQSRERAQLAIQLARGVGVEPVSPIALFEFASTVEDPRVALEFYRTADVFAGLSKILTGGEETYDSRFVHEVEEHETHPEREVVRGFHPAKLRWAGVGVFATLAGIALGMALVRWRSDERG